MSQLGRSTQGVRVMNVADEDKVTAVAIATDSTKKRVKKAAEAVEPDPNQTALIDVPAADSVDEEDDELAAAETD